MTETTNKRYALSVVKRWAQDADHASDCFYTAIVKAAAYASCAEIAEVAGLSRQGVRKILNRSGNSVDKKRLKIVRSPS